MEIVCVYCGETFELCETTYGNFKGYVVHKGCGKRMWIRTENGRLSKARRTKRRSFL